MTEVRWCRLVVWRTISNMRDVDAGNDGDEDAQTTEYEEG